MGEETEERAIDKERRRNPNHTSEKEGERNKREESVCNKLRPLILLPNLRALCSPYLSLSFSHCMAPESGNSISPIP